MRSAMIKTHKPRGHYWTHASAFQQTEGFRNIRYEDCTPPPAQVLVPDSDDELPEPKRAAKRRRIEELADSFLSGQKLVVHSATPCFGEVEATIVRNKKSSTDPKFVFPEVDHFNESEAVWEDVEGDAEFLARLASFHRQPASGERERASKNNDQSHEGVNSVEEHAEASCGRARRTRVPNIRSGPSEEALRQAAALRARRTLKTRSNSEIPLAAEGTPRVAENLHNRFEPHSDPVDHASAVLGNVQSKEWLSRRKSRFSFGDRDHEDDSADELRLSRIETPSISASCQKKETSSSSVILRQSSRQARKALDHDRVVPADKSQLANTMYQGYDNDKSFGSIDDLVPISPRRKPGNKKSDDSDESEKISSYHTAQEDIGIEQTVQTEQVGSQEDSQSRLLQTHGILARPRRSWFSVNEGVIDLPADFVQPRGTFTPTSDTPASSVRRALQASAKVNAPKQKEDRRPKSAGNNTPQQSTTARRPSSAPTESQGAHNGEKDDYLKPAYPNVQSTQNGVSPFTWRRPDSRSGDRSVQQERSVALEQGKKRRAVKFPSSDNRDAGNRQTRQQSGKSRVADPPLLDMSFEHDSSFAPNLNMALVDGHPKSMLPAEPGSSWRSSAVKNAIYREMENADAEMSRCEDEPPTSSLLGNEPEPMSMPRRKKSQHVTESRFWPGTQAALQQAEQNLLVSPEKADDTSDANKRPVETVDGPEQRESPTSSGREPLKQLSQEPIASTQALIADFVGFSTVKKPRAAAYYHSPSYTPTATGKSVCGGASALISRKAPSSAPEASVLPSGMGSHRSDLQASTSFAQTPSIVAKQDVLPTKQTSTSMQFPPSRPTPKSILKSSDKRTPATYNSTAMSEEVSQSGNTEVNLTSGSFTSGLPLSSFQAAQPRPELPREDSDIDRTIDDLTREVLGMTDLQGYLSQG